MKTLAGTLLLVLAVLVAAPAWAANMPSGIDFKGYEEAKKLAADNKQPVVLYFWADWCGYCKVFNSDVLTDPAVQTELKKFQTVNIDVDNDPGKLGKKYRAKGLPTLVFLNSAGEKVFTLPGALPPEILVAVLSYVETGAYANEDIEEYVEKYFESRENAGH